MKRRLHRWFRAAWATVRAGCRDMRWQFAGTARFLRRTCQRTWNLFTQGEKARYLIQGLPAIAVLGLALFVSIEVVIHSSADVAKFYRAAAGQAREEGDFSLARIAYERICLLDSDRPEDRYGLAMAYLGQGEHSTPPAMDGRQPENPELARVRSLIAPLAPIRGPVGYGPAHLWTAQDILTRQSPTTQHLLTAETQLHRAIKAQHDSATAHALLGMIYMGRQQNTDALPHLQAAVRTQPQYGILLANVYTRLGEKLQARSWAEKSVPIFEGVLRTNPDDIGARVNLADAKVVLGDYSGAVETLRQGADRPSGEPCRRPLANTYATWADSLPAENELNRADRRQLIQEGLRVEPDNSDLLKLLVKATNETGNEAEKARALVQSLLSSDRSSPALHFVLGNDAFQREKFDEARQHFESAYKLAPNHPGVAHNLAWLLATANPPDLPRALELLDAAVKRMPQDIRIHKTRGLVLAKMGRWKESVDELELCLAASPKDRELHKSLAEAYTKLNLPSLAAEHARLADAGAP